MSRFTLFLQVLCLLAYCHSSSIPNGDQKTWNFEFISIGTNSSDENLIKLDLKLKRLSRGVYGLTGTVVINFDIEYGDNTMVGANVYRSVTGSSEYQPTPFQMQTQHLFDFFDTFYKNILMNSLADCSNLPQFKGKFTPPFEKKTYTLNNCKISNEGLPPHMSEGYYKVTIVGSGKVDYVIESICKVERDY